MARFQNDLNFQSFVKTLDNKIHSYNEPTDKEGFYKAQKKQVETLVKLEKQFRNLIIKGPYGSKVYKAFIDHINNNKRNILSARPYFRERQEVFTDNISQAIKEGNEKVIFKFNINFKFVEFAVGAHSWPKNGKVMKLFKEIRDLRNKIAELNMPLAISRAKIFWSCTPEAHLSYMDMVQISAEGLMAAIDKFVLPFSRVFRSVCIGRSVGELISSYSINAYTFLLDSNQVPKIISDFKAGDKILGVNQEGEIIETEVITVHDHGILDGFKVDFDDGYSIVCSGNHKFLTENGMVSILDIVEQKLGILTSELQNKAYRRMENEMWNSNGISSSNDGSYEDMSSLSGYKGPRGKGNNQEGQFIQDQERALDFDVWDRIRIEKEDVSSLGILRTMPKYKEKEERRCYKSSTGSEHSERRLDQCLRPSFSETQTDVGSSSSLRGLSENNIRQLSEKQQRMASGEHGCVESERQQERARTLGENEVRSTSSTGTTFKNERWNKEEMAGETGRGLRNSQESLDCIETVQNRKMDERERDLSMGSQINSMWRNLEAGGFCIPGSIDMDRDGWELSLQGDIEDGTAFALCSAEGRDVARRMPETWERYVDSIGSGLFQERNGGDEARLAANVYKNAPVSNPGSLVSRQVIRISPVGQVKMCDLEVAHPKHNFLLPNGIVTSNSETFMHFYPNDRKKLYRANKIVRRFKDAKVIDYEELANTINEGLEAEGDVRTTADELRELMLASGTVSSDSSSPIENQNNSAVQLTARFPATEESRPDVISERLDLSNKLNTAINELSIMEIKLLRLKGVNLNNVE